MFREEIKMIDDNKVRIEELEELITAKEKVLESKIDELKVEWERQKAILRSIVTLEDEVKQIREKIDVLKEKKRE